MKMHRLIFGLLLQIFIGGVVTADQLPIKRYTIADGLARDTVNCLVHDPHEFMWFCTPEGLSRFDGYGFTNYGMADGLPSRYVNHFVADGANLTSQRQALIDRFNSGGRGAVLYRLADDNEQGNPINNRAFIDAEYNRAFVFTQYAGYLRRNSDIAGFLFWLGQVNSAPLRDVARQHAMVCSFVTSAEYQNRFSSVVTHSNGECN